MLQLFSTHPPIEERVRRLERCGAACGTRRLAGSSPSGRREPQLSRRSRPREPLGSSSCVAGSKTRGRTGPGWDGAAKVQLIAFGSQPGAQELALSHASTTGSSWMMPLEAACDVSTSQLAAVWLHVGQSRSGTVTVDPAARCSSRPRPPAASRSDTCSAAGGEPHGGGADGDGDDVAENHVRSSSPGRSRLEHDLPELGALREERLSLAARRRAASSGPPRAGASPRPRSAAPRRARRQSPSWSRGSRAGGRTRGGGR